MKRSTKRCAFALIFLIPSLVGALFLPAPFRFRKVDTKCQSSSWKERIREQSSLYASVEDVATESSDVEDSDDTCPENKRHERFAGVGR